MKKRCYRLALIYEDFVSDMLDYSFRRYDDAFMQAGKEMKNDKLVQAVLVYSNKPSQRILKSCTTLPRLEANKLL